MMLKPQDIVILLKLISIGPRNWSYNMLSYELAMSASEVHGGIKRVSKSHLFNKDQKVPIKQALLEYLEHGIRYSFPPDLGGMTRGMPTGIAAPPLNSMFNENEEQPVWPTADGSHRGYEFSPLFKSVPEAAKSDSALYELLALVDAIRGGRSRERKAAIREVERRLFESIHG